MEDTHARITLRLPKELHEKLEKQADQKTRSLNAEIVARLEESFVMSGRQFLAIVSNFEQQLAEAALDKHILFNMINELALVQNFLTQGLKSGQPVPPEMIEILDGWSRETDELLKEASEKITGSLEEAMAKYQKAGEEFLARAARRHDTAARVTTGLTLPTEIFGKIETTTAEGPSVDRAPDRRMRVRRDKPTSP